MSYFKLYILKTSQIKMIESLNSLNALLLRVFDYFDIKFINTFIDAMIKYQETYINIDKKCHNIFKIMIIYVELSQEVDTFYVYPTTK